MEYQKDCIHIKACRRYSKLLKSKGILLCFGRGCTDNCTAYESIEDIRDKNKLYTTEEVRKVMHGANYDGVNGYTDIIIEDYI